jgi:hypothetical protein
LFLISFSKRYIRRGRPEEGSIIFENETFTFPGFVEFDDVNSKVLTFSAAKRLLFLAIFSRSSWLTSILSKYRVWDLNTYKLLYNLRAETISEIKISPSILLVIHHPEKSQLSSTLHDVESGEIIGRFNQMIARGKRIDFVEQFGEFLLLKQGGRNLTITNVHILCFPPEDCLCIHSMFFLDFE